MEKAMCSTSLTKQTDEPHVRNIPGVQKNVDFIMEHLNDPNLDLSHPPFYSSPIKEEPTTRYGQNGNVGIYFDKSDLFHPLISPL